MAPPCLTWYQKLYRRLVLHLMSTRLYYYLLKNVIPYIRLTTYYASFRGWQYVRGYRLLRPGDFIVSKDNKKLTNFLIPGEWNHAAPVIDKGEECEWEISEMTHHNYTLSTFFDVCMQADRVAIYRCKTFDEDYINNVYIPFVKNMRHAVYDKDFAGASEETAKVLTLKIPALYCSELVFQADAERRLGADLSDFVGIGRPYISPTGLTLADNVYCVWDSAAEPEPVWHNGGTTA